MRHLALYPTIPTLAVQREVARALDRNCTLCPFSKGAKTVCMKAEGSPGGVLFVSDYPGANEDAIGRPMVGPAGRLLRGIYPRYWKGAVAFDNALRCDPKRKKANPKNVDACRGYLSKTLIDARPQRVVAMGASAIYSLLGRKAAPFSVRRGYAWIAQPDGVLTPVFLLMNPAAALRNAFVRQWFEADLRWALTADPSELRKTLAWDGIAYVIETLKDAERCAAEMRGGMRITVDIESAGKMFERGTKTIPRYRVLSVATAIVGADDAWVWPGELLAQSLEIRAVFAGLMRDPAVAKVGQDAKFDQHGLASDYGIELDRLADDTRLQRKILDAEADADLELQQELIGMGGGKEEMDVAIAAAVKRCRKKNPKPGVLEAIGPDGASNLDLVNAIRTKQDKVKTFAYGLVPKDLLYRYNGVDVVTTGKLVQRHDREFSKEPALASVWAKLVANASMALERVERWGVPVDLDALDAFESVLEMREQEADRQIQNTAPGLNPESPPQLRKLLFETMGLRPFKTTKTGLASTDADTLEYLRGRAPIVDDILTKRRVTKLVGWCGGIRKHTRSTGLIHCELNLAGARTGRLAAKKPNMQNIDRAADSPEGKLARDCFVALPDHVLIEFDYKQLELFVAAILSGDPKMQAILASGEDMHLRTAKMIAKSAWGKDPESITKQSPERTWAKSLLFAMLYGMGMSRLAREIKVSVQQAEKTKAAILGEFVMLARWLKERLEEARRTGFVWTWWDGKPFRRRPLYRVADTDSKSRNTAENGAVNTPVQGTANDFCLFSLVEVVRWIVREAIDKLVQLILPIHDSMLLHVHKSMVEEVLYTIPRIMTSWNSGGLPLKVDIKMGRSFGSLEEVKRKAA